MTSKHRLLSSLLLGCGLATGALADQSALKAVMKWEDADFLSSACFLVNEWRADSDEAVPRQIRAQLDRLKAAAGTSGAKDLQALVAPARRGEEADRQLAAYREQFGHYKFGALQHVFGYGSTVYAFVALQPVAAGGKPLVASLAFALESQSVTGFDPAPPSDTAQALLFRWYYSKFGPGADSTGSRCSSADLARLNYRIPLSGADAPGLLVRGSGALEDMPLELQRRFKPGAEAASRALSSTEVSTESWRRLQEYRVAPGGKDFEKQLVGDRLLFWLDVGPLAVAYTRLENATVRPVHFLADGNRWRLGHLGLSNMTTRIFDRRELAEAALQSPPFNALRNSR